MKKMKGSEIKRLEIRMTVGELMQKMVSGEIRPSRLRREELSPALQVAVRDVWDRCAKFWGVMTFEEFEIGFLRDMHPEQEVRVWQKIATAFEAYMTANPGANKVEVISTLVLTSMGAGHE